MDYLPIFADVRNRRVLVVGDGELAQRKLRLLRQAGAAVEAIAPAEFHPEDVAGCAAVFGANGDDESDRAVADAARAANVPVNIVDRPELSTFIVPAIVDRSPVVVGISSGGAAPVLARLLRARIEALLPARLGDLARFAARFRRAVRGVVADPVARRRFWERFFAGPVAERVLAGDERAPAEMMALVNRTGQAPKGAVYVVGAGPGDPDLLTVQALRLMQQADIVLYDELVGPEILDRVRRDAERVYVGKVKGRHALPQDEINQRLVREAASGKRVLRLKGGDPFVFGRGGEEVDYLRRHGIDVIVAPGLTAALGCLAAAGIPLTHRDYASEVTFVTGHTRDGHEPDWVSLARPGRTVVVYMGLSTAGTIAARLLSGGLSSATPVAVIQNGTLPDQRISTGTLAELGAIAARHAGQGPALLVIGQVVTLADAWQAAQPRQEAV